DRASSPLRSERHGSLTAIEVRIAKASTTTAGTSASRNARPRGSAGRTAASGGAACEASEDAGVPATSGPRPATQPAQKSAVTATAGTNHVQSSAECTPNTT